MTAHTGTESFTGTRYYISATLPDTIDAAGFQSTDILWTEITKVTDFPEYGPSRAVGKITPINGAIDKFVGAPDYGSGNMMFIDLPSDPGQIIVKTAAYTNGTNYSMKVVSPDGEIDFLQVLIAAYKLAAAKENTAKTRSCSLEVTQAVVNVAAT